MALRLPEYLPEHVVRAGFVRVFRSMLPGGGGNLETGTLKTWAFTLNEKSSLEVMRLEPSRAISDKTFNLT